MTKQSLVNFIEEKRAEGLDDSKITRLLLENGWQMDIIQHVLRGEPGMHRNLEPILDIKKQPYLKAVVIGTSLVLFLLLFYAALLFSI